jgi:superfamily II DNA or RNA helicase
LKQFQLRALDSLEAFLEQWHDLGSVADAFYEATGADYQTPSWDKNDAELRRWVPSVCLQAGTGGGKTLMATTWLEPIAESVAGGPVPLRVVLWLVPTKTLIEQTVRILRDPKGMYQPILSAAFGKATVIDRDEMMSVTPAQLNNGVTIVVSTAQGFRREEVDGLRAYRQNGALLPHFPAERELAGPLVSEEGELLDNDVEITPSLVNLMRMKRPVIVIDEAHRNQSALSWQMLSNLRPRFVLELTATPRQRANILHAISPVELKAEDMIRMPVNLHRTEGWMDALTDARRNRQRLERAARRVGDRVRPIVLVQVENKDAAKSSLSQGRVAVYDALSFLTAELKVKREAIVVRTGDVDELTGKNLLSATSPVRWVITVQAAAEGWDCPFAMTLCAISATKSTVRVTQLLGRCLRQDLARKSRETTLNETYVYAATPDFAATAKDVIASMEALGFHADDVRVFGNGATRTPRDPDRTEVRKEFEGQKLPVLALRLAPRSRAHTVTASEQLAPFASKKLRLDRVDGIPKPLHKEDAESLDIDLEGKIVATELNLPTRPSNKYEGFTSAALIDALRRGVRDKRVSHDEMGKIIEATVESLERDRWSVSDMFGRYRAIAEAIATEVRTRYADHLYSGFTAAAQKGVLISTEAALPDVVLQRNESFTGLDLKKHVYPEISGMNGEEQQLARDLASSEKVHWWWRNPDRTGWPIIGYWGRFYPDFIVRLTNGRTLVIEYKGKQLAASEDTERKENLGTFWASVAGRRVDFYLVTKDPDPTRGAQISPPELARNILELTT